MAAAPSVAGISVVVVVAVHFGCRCRCRRWCRSTTNFVVVIVLLLTATTEAISSHAATLLVLKSRATTTVGAREQPPPPPPLHLAVFRNQTALVERLLDNGALLEARARVAAVEEPGDGDGDAASSSTNNNVSSTNVDATPSEMTPLQLAVARSSPAMVRLLLERGANVSVREDEEEEAEAEGGGGGRNDGGGMQPLHRAVSLDRPDIVELLVGRGGANLSAEYQTHAHAHARTHNATDAEKTASYSCAHCGLTSTPFDQATALALGGRPRMMELFVSRPGWVQLTGVQLDALKLETAMSGRVPRGSRLDGLINALTTSDATTRKCSEAAVAAVGKRPPIQTFERWVFGMYLITYMYN
jgi:hypothetical protein